MDYVEPADDFFDDDFWGNWDDETPVDEPPVYEPPVHATPAKGMLVKETPVHATPVNETWLYLPNLYKASGMYPYLDLP